ncbi:MAG: DUF2066 domain-containing protein [Woeseiaceae bacterium]|nr:DUF2066 domain-containing protein [Woeseiaceae bacterium]
MRTEEITRGRPLGPVLAHCAAVAAGIRQCGLAVRRSLAAAIAVSALFAPAQAIEMDNLYTVQVPFDAFEADAQNLAYQAALTQVLVRITGTTAIAEWEQVAEWFPTPGRFVLQYRPGPDDTLEVSLDGQAIENILRQAGVPVWGNDRPLTLIWIAVDWGMGEREIVAADDPDRMPGDARSIDRNRLLRERVTEIATQRGIPVLFPLLDIEDLENVSFTDIWGGFDDLLLLASARYEAETVLVGRVRAGDLPETNRWTWYLGGERQLWTGDTAQAIHLLADALAERFRVDSRAPSESIRLSISGIDSVTAFGRVQRYMENLRGVDQVAIESVAGDRIVYVVSVRGGLERLQRTLEVTSILEPVDPFNQDVEIVPIPDEQDEIEPRMDRVRPRATIEYLYRSD